MPQMVGNWNPDGSGGIYNNHPDSLSYSSVLGRWSLRQEDLQPFSASAAFNLFVPAHGTGRYQHLNVTVRHNTSIPLHRIEV